MIRPLMTAMAFVLISGAVAAADKNDHPSTATQAKEAVKDGARAAGHAARDTTRAIGHGTRDAAKTVGHAARDTTRAIGHGTRDALHDVEDATSSAWDRVKEAFGR